MKKHFLLLTALMAHVFLAGCSSEPKDLTSQALTPTSPEQVKIYQKRPDNYGIVGTVVVEITPDMKWDEQADANKLFDLLKGKAAAKGANGLLFELDRSEFDVNATAGYHGQFYQLPIRIAPQRAAVARAIWVNPK
ncbi:MAG TPA: hypothetical protein VHD56_10015 [Tepidisphaeraceae bacterium]|nr:hypothetical protein [Tepidisphaeraceae bacterium]